MRIGRIPSIISTIIEYRHRHSIAFFSTVSTVVTITIISDTFERELYVPIMDY